MRTSEVLNKAADLIKEVGWATGPEGMSVSGPYCVQGAVQSATGFSAVVGYDIGYGPALPYFDCIPSQAGEALMGYLRVDARGVWIWNDAPGRTAAEVIEVLRACALIEAAREEQDAAWESYAGNVAVSA